jgi:hypothetical protein
MPRLLSLSAAAALAALAACSSSSTSPAATPVAGANAPVASPAASAPAADPVPSPTPEPTPDPGPGLIAYVRVAFYGVQCPHGRTPPKNGAKQLPVGCTGYVTATPKKADGSDVKPKDHGPDITWRLDQGEGLVKVIDDPEQPFNKQLVGKVVGGFTLCAIVRGVEGCLDGNVI